MPAVLVLVLTLSAALHTGAQLAPAPHMVAVVSSQSPDPAIGTWRLNVSKSRYEPGPAPKKETITFAQVGSDTKVIITGIDGRANMIATEQSANCDGREYPIVGSPYYDTVVGTRVDARSAEALRKKAGKVVQTARRVISSDG